jgi:hypothetical protein
MGVSGQHHVPAALYPWGKDLRYPLDRRLGGPQSPVWTQRLEEKSSASVGDRNPVVQSVVRHGTDWATAAPRYMLMYLFILVSNKELNLKANSLRLNLGKF